MLYESAWVAIKAKDYPRARRQLDLLLLNAPNSPLAPEVKLLIGSLHIRQNEYGPATDVFTKTRDEFEPVHRLLETELAKTPNPPAYFKDLINKNLSKFDVAAILPQSTARWLKDENDVVRVSTLIGDENDLRKSLAESEEIVKRLEKALSGPARVNVFPELAAVRAKATEIANQLTEGKRILAAREQKIIEPVIGAQKAELDALSAESARLEQALAALPAKTASIQERMAKQRAALNELDKKASELSVEVTTMQRAVAGIRKLYRDAMREKEEQQVQTPAATTPPTVDPGATTYAAKADELTKRLAGTRGGIDKTKERIDKLKDLVLQKPSDAKGELEAVSTEVESLRAGIEGVRKDILDAASSIGVDDNEMQAAAQVRAQYEQLLTKQRALIAGVESRLSGGDRVKAEQIRSILDRARAVDGKIASLNAKIDEILDAKLKDIQVTLAEEKALVADHQAKLAAYTGESAEVGGAVVADSWKAVTNRFYNIVVRADVGIIDVAWALKDSATRETNRLVAERKRELKLLDDEFKEVLKEQP
jgi:chromosome segregation ATPase